MRVRASRCGFARITGSRTTPRLARACEPGATCAFAGSWRSKESTLAQHAVTFVHEVS